MINYLEAIAAIQKLTKQKCNEFTLMHYVSNGYLDIFIRAKYDICQVSLIGYQADADYFADSIENDYEDYLKVDIGSISTRELCSVLMTENTPIEIISVMKCGKVGEYVLLKSKVNEDTHTVVKEFHAIRDHESIELAFVVAELGIGKEFVRGNFLFDEDQIKSIPSFHQAQNKENKFYAPELGLAIELWEKMYLNEKGELPSGKTRSIYIDWQLDKQEIEASGLKRLKERMRAILNPNPKAKIKTS